MGGTGNSKTYPYGIQNAGGKDQVFNRVTGEVIEEFEQFSVGPAQLVNSLVGEFNSMGPAGQAHVLAPNVEAVRAEA